MKKMVVREAWKIDAQCVGDDPNTLAEFNKMEQTITNTLSKRTTENLFTTNFTFNRRSTKYISKQQKENYENEYKKEIKVIIWTKWNIEVEYIEEDMKALSQVAQMEKTVNKILSARKEKEDIFTTGFEHNRKIKKLKELEY